MLIAGFKVLKVTNHVTFIVAGYTQKEVGNRLKLDMARMKMWD